MFPLYTATIVEQCYKKTIVSCTLYLWACGARLALSAWETWEAEGASFSLRTPNTCCPFNTLKEKIEENIYSVKKGTETFLKRRVHEMLMGYFCILEFMPICSWSPTVTVRQKPHYLIQEPLLMISSFSFLLKSQNYCPIHNLTQLKVE